MIYIIRDEELHRLKIGFTDADTPESRRKALQTGNSSRLAIVAVFPGDRQAEDELHDRFDSERILGEWFQDTPDVLKSLFEIVEKNGFRMGVEHVAKRTERRDGFFPDKTWPLAIYLAGKIEKNCWRRALVPAVREAFAEGECNTGDRGWPMKWPILNESIFDVHSYTGPFFMSCDHGCFHGDDAHGLGANSIAHHNDAGRPAEVTRLCFDAIDRSDVVFAWIDAHDCYGTIAELGYARAKGKHVWVAGKRHYRDMWFVTSMADECCIYDWATPERALRQLLNERAGWLQRHGVDAVALNAPPS